MKLRLRVAVVIVLALLPLRPAHAQPAHTRQYTMASWTSREGLPSSYILSLAQDRDGYLWIGTNAGLVRFDGMRFSAWPRNHEMPSPNPLIYSVMAARDGSLWVVFGGQSRIVHDRGGRIDIYTAKDGLPEGGMRAIVERRDGTVWAAGINGLARFRDGRWDRVSVSITAIATQSALSEDRDGHLWATAPDGIFRYDDETGKFAPMQTGLNGALRFNSADGRIVVTGGGRVATMNADETERRVSPIAPAALTGPFPALHDRRGHVWIGTNGDGLFRLDEPSLSSSERYTERDGLSGDQIRVLLEDRDGNLWVGTQAGLTRITEASIAQVTTRPSATSENVSTLVADAVGNVWVEIPGALVRISNGERRVFTAEAGARFDNITAMFADAQGAVWLATNDGRLTYHANGVFRTVPREEGTQAPIVGISADNSGRIWTFDGHFFRRRGARPVDDAVIKAPAGLIGNPSRFFHVDRQGRLWAGTDGGLVAMYDGNRFQLFGPEQGIPAGQLSGVAEDARGRIWIASDNGLSTFDGGHFVTLTTRRGVLANRIFFVIPDETDSLWIGVGTGIVRITEDELLHAMRDPRHYIGRRLYDASDGLRGTPVLRGTPMASRARDGSIWFVTTSGIAVMDPKRLPARPAPPTPRIENVHINGREVSVAAGLEVPPRTSSLQIEYSALNLTAPSKVRFRHQLEGVDADWVEDAGVQTVYANLAPGSYRFQLAASNGDEMWQPVTWAFSVQPTWYQTRAFYAGATAGIILLTWLAWQLRLRQIHRQFSVVLAERARVGREIHDTLLQSLVGMSLQLDNLSDQLDPRSWSMKNEIARMRRQVERYIEEAQQSIWELRSHHAETSDLPSLLRERGERITESTGVRFAFVSTGTPRKVAPRVQQQVLRIAQEAMVNAVRHAHPSEVRVELAYEDTGVHLRVADDGRGFDPDHAAPDGGGHWGISIMRERAEQIGGSFTVSSAPDRGTRIDIVAPAEA